MHAVVTGASSGIGATIAEKFADAGYNLTLVARRENLLKELQNKLSVRCNLVVADLLDLDNCTSWIQPSVEELGPVDVFVNNAGIQYVGPTLDVGVKNGENTIRLNLLVPMRLIDAVLPNMIERRSGVIVNISSLAAINPTPYMYHYSASKAGIGAASETLHSEMKEYDVHVVTVYPGPVVTPMEAAARKKIDHAIANLLPSGDPEVLASLILKAIKKKRRRVIYPTVYKWARNFTPLSQWITTSFAPKPK